MEHATRQPLLHHLVRALEDLNGEEDGDEVHEQWCVAPIDPEEGLADPTLCLAYSREELSDTDYQYLVTPRHAAGLAVREMENYGHREFLICEKCKAHPEYEGLVALELLALVGE